MNTDTVGSRIRSRRREMKLTQKDIARYIGISPSAVTQWEQDTTEPSGQSLVHLADILECSPDWIMTGKEVSIMIPERYPSPQRNIQEIPVISWVQAGYWTDSCSENSINNANADETVFATTRVSDKAFALKVKGDSMTSSGGLLSIPEGATVIVDPEFGGIDNAVGKIIVAQLGGTGEATIKKLALDGSIYYLIPLNPSFKALEVTQDCRLIGLVRQVIINFQE